MELKLTMSVSGPPLSRVDVEFLMQVFLLKLTLWMIYSCVLDKVRKLESTGGGAQKLCTL